MSVFIALQIETSEVVDEENEEAKTPKDRANMEEKYQLGKENREASFRRVEPLINLWAVLWSELQLVFRIF